MSIISGNGYDEIIMCGNFNLDILNYNNNENTLNPLNSLTSQSLIPIITKLTKHRQYINKPTKRICFPYSYL